MKLSIVLAVVFLSSQAFAKLKCENAVNKVLDKVQKGSTFYTPGQLNKEALGPGFEFNHLVSENVGISSVEEVPGGITRFSQNGKDKAFVYTNGENPLAVSVPAYPVEVFRQYGNTTEVVPREMVFVFGPNCKIVEIFSKEKGDREYENRLTPNNCPFDGFSPDMIGDQTDRDLEEFLRLYDTDEIDQRQQTAIYSSLYERNWVRAHIREEACRDFLPQPYKGMQAKPYQGRVQPYGGRVINR